MFNGNAQTIRQTYKLRIDFAALSHQAELLLLLQRIATSQTESQLLGGLSTLLTEITLQASHGYEALPEFDLARRISNHPIDDTTRSFFT